MAALADAYAILKTGTLWSSTGKCKGYAPSNPGEAAKIDAYVAAVDAGTFPQPPVLSTATGRGLVGMLAALAPTAPAPPPTAVTSGTQKPYGVLRLGSTYAAAGDLTRYGTVVCGISDADKAAALPATMKRLVYMDATDIPTFFTGVDRQEAISNGWVLELEGDKTTYLAGVGHPDYQAALVREVHAFLTTHKLDGFYFDDVIASLDGYYGSAWPAKYPTPADWYTAMAGCVVNVGKQLKALGHYVGANATAFFPANRGVFTGTDSNSGTAEAAWIKMLAPGLSFVMVENWMVANGHLRGVTSPVSWDNQWDGWQALVRVAQDAGLDFVPTINVDAGHDDQVTYTQASFLLDKDDGRDGGTLVFGGGDPYSTAWAKPVGKALGPKSKSSNAWSRRFDNGVIVTVDPVARTASIA